MNWLKNLVAAYFVEVNGQAPMDEDELNYMAENFCNDAERLIKARLDFKGLGKED